ncbi:MAG: CocE/NonD family hydrolase [Nocardioidaceae bacterium]|nr:CocE/NonD family hydrolase [Nocardioidaceae bacterium]
MPSHDPAAPGRRLRRRVQANAVETVMGLPRTSKDHEVARDLEVPMPDGTRLLGDLHRPVDATGPMPVVLVRLPYGRAGTAGLLFGTTLARRGLQVFIQSTRGTFGSGGQFRPFATEHEDGMATLAWVREQAWCDGRVAMTGGSYFGHTQWAIAPYADPPLECFSPHITAARITSVFYDHGAPGLTNALTWASQVGRQERRSPLAPLMAPVERTHLRRVADRLPLRAADVAVAGGPVAFWRDFVDHAAPGDTFWDHADHSTVDMARLPPANMVTGWWDVFLPGQLDDYRRLREAGNPARLVVGPWLHGEPGELRALLASEVAWLDHHLRGGPAPAGPPVKVFLQQADTWLEMDHWPPPDRTRVTHHLHGDGTLAVDPPPASGSVTATEGTTRLVYDPADPTPSIGGPLLQGPGKQADNRDVEKRPDVAVFTGAPLDSDVDVVGQVSARVHLRIAGSHADVFVRLCDVAPDGTSSNVVDGIRRLHPDTVPADDVSVLADGSLVVEVELYPTAYRFRAGHRFRVQVSGGAFPRFARNLGTDDPLASGRGGSPYAIEIVHDPSDPSTISVDQLR